MAAPSNAELLEQVKAYLRIDFDEEDILLTAFVAGAVSFLRNAGVKDTVRDDPLYVVIVQMLVSLYYENRNVAAEKLAIPAVIINFITQLSVKSQLSSGGGAG